jgi:hypothetical protein
MPKPACEEVRQQWKENILKQRESGLSIGSWCRQNNIAVCTFVSEKYTHLDKKSRSGFLIAAL